MGIYKIRFGGPLVTTSKAFNFNVRCSRLCPLRGLNNVSYGNVALAHHSNGPIPEMTRAPSNVLGTMKLRGPNISIFVGRSLP